MFEQDQCRMQIPDLLFPSVRIVSMNDGTTRANGLPNEILETIISEALSSVFFGGVTMNADV